MNDKHAFDPLGASNPILEQPVIGNQISHPLSMAMYHSSNDIILYPIYNNAV